MTPGQGSSTAPPGPARASTRDPVSGEAPAGGPGPAIDVDRPGSIHGLVPEAHRIECQSSAASRRVSVLELTDADFQAQVLEASTTVLVDVWAPWCGPCRLMAPLMTWAAEQYADTLVVGKLEADGNPLTRDQYKVTGLPLLILFRDGKELARHEGAMAKPQLQAFLDAYL